MSRFLAAEAEFFLNTMFAFFWGEFGDFDSVDDHGIGVMSFGGRGVGEGVVCLVGDFGVSSGNVVSLLPLGLESSGLLVPFIYGGGNSVHGHDVLHQRGWNSCGKVSDQNVGVRDVGKGDVVSEHRDIFHERGGV